MQIFNCRRVSIPDPLVFQGSIVCLNIYEPLHEQIHVIPSFLMEESQLESIF